MTAKRLHLGLTNDYTPVVPDSKPSTKIADRQRRSAWNLFAYLTNFLLRPPMHRMGATYRIVELITKALDGWPRVV